MKLLKSEDIITAYTFQILRDCRDGYATLRQKNDLALQLNTLRIGTATNQYDNCDQLIMAALAEVLDLTAMDPKTVNCRKLALEILMYFDRVPRKFEEEVTAMILDDTYLSDVYDKFKVNINEGNAILEETIKEAPTSAPTTVEEFAEDSYYKERKETVVALKTNPPNIALVALWGEYKKEVTLCQANILTNVLLDLGCFEDTRLHPDWDDFVKEVVAFKPKANKWIHYNVESAAYDYLTSNDLIPTKKIYPVIVTDGVVGKKYEYESSSYQLMQTDMEYLIESKTGKPVAPVVPTAMSADLYEWFDEHIDNCYKDKEKKVKMKDNLIVPIPAHCKKDVKEGVIQPTKFVDLTNNSEATDYTEKDLHSISKLNENTVGIPVENVINDDMQEKIEAILEQIPDKFEVKRLRKSAEFYKFMIKHPNTTLVALRSFDIVRPIKYISNPNEWLSQPGDINTVMSEERERALLDSKVKEEVSKMYEEEEKAKAEMKRQQVEFEAKRQESSMPLAGLLHDYLLNNNMEPISITIDLGDKELIIKSKK